MADDTKPRRRAAPIAVQPVLVSPETAAFMLGQIGLETLRTEFVVTGRLVARRISPGRIGYRVADVMALADDLEPVVPGRA